MLWCLQGARLRTFITRHLCHTHPCTCVFSHLEWLIFSRCPPGGRCGEIRHPGVHGLRQKKRRGGQEGHAGQQVCPPSPPSPLLPHPQQPHPHGSAGPGGVEISFPWCFYTDRDVGVLAAFLAVRPLTERSSPLIFSFFSPYLPTVWPWASPSRTRMMTPTLPITNWWVSSLHFRPWNSIKQIKSCKQSEKAARNQNMWPWNRSKVIWSKSQKRRCSAGLLGRWWRTCQSPDGIRGEKLQCDLV